MSESEASVSQAKANGTAREVDFPACIAREFPSTFDVSWQAILDVIEVVDGRNMDALAKHSLGLLGYAWEVYLRCSVARAVRVATSLSARVPVPARVLDVGSYLGNFSLLAARSGYEVHALDTYDEFGSCTSGVTELLKSAGIRIIQPTTSVNYLADLADSSFDAVMFLGVIEHIPHSPKALLLEILRVLRPGGVLVMDTPNQAYIFNRWRLAEGQSIYGPLSSQFHTPPPFEGHHREFTIEETEWMLHEVGFVDLITETFNYSLYGLSEFSGDTLRGILITEDDWTSREVIMCSALKP